MHVLPLLVYLLNYWLPSLVEVKTAILADRNNHWLLLVSSNSIIFFLAQSVVWILCWRCSPVAMKVCRLTVSYLDRKWRMKSVRLKDVEGIFFMYNLPWRLLTVNDRCIYEWKVGQYIKMYEQAETWLSESGWYCPSIGPCNTIGAPPTLKE